MTTQLIKVLKAVFHCGLLTIALLIATISLSIHSLADEPVRSGDMEFISQGTANIHQGLHLFSDANFSISGMIARVDLTQRFQNPTDQWVEGRYLFPLPENAAINAMQIHIGERTITGVIEEKQMAKKIYKQAKADGKKAGLLEHHRPNMFSQKIANIGPGETITVNLTYLQPIDYKQGIFQLRFPMTLTPRYIPGQTLTSTDNTILSEEEEIYNPSPEIAIDEYGWGWSTPTDQVTDAHLITPPMVDHNTNHELHNPIAIKVSLDAGLPLAKIDSAYHDISIIKANGRHEITLVDGQVSMNRDFVLSWQPIDNHNPQAAMFSEQLDDGHYYLLMLMPGSLGQKGIAVIDKEVIFIIDTSGSMGGGSIQQAKSGLEHAIRQLKPDDRFNIIEFNSTYSSLFRKPLGATANNIHSALQFIRKLQANGGTEMLPALSAAFAQPASTSHLRQIVFITDGSIGNEQALFQQIHQHLGNARLFTVGIGSAPNSFFMRKAAQFGRGSFTYIGDISEVQTKMSALFKKIGQPSLHSIHIDTVNADKSQDSRVDIFPARIPDVYIDEPLLVSLHSDKALMDITIKGTYQNSNWQESLTSGKAIAHDGVAHLWARNKIESLLDAERTNTDRKHKGQIKKDIISVALKHQLLSPYTSFVAIEEEISRPNDKPLTPSAIPNAVAQGQRLQTVAYPQTATSLWLHLLLGAVALLGLLLQRWRL